MFLLVEECELKGFYGVPNASLQGDYEEQQCM